MALSLWVGNITLTVTVLLLLPSFLLNWKNVSNFFQAHVSGLEYYTVTTRCLLSWFYCPAFSLFLNWKNVLNFFHGPCLWVESITSLLPCYTASYHFSLLKLEECIKLLSWPMPLSREYYLFYCPFVYCPALLSPDYSLFLNWKNVSNFFHGPCLWVESIN